MTPPTYKINGVVDSIALFSRGKNLKHELDKNPQVCTGRFAALLDREGLAKNKDRVPQH